MCENDEKSNEMTDEQKTKILKTYKRRIRRLKKLKYFDGLCFVMRLCLSK